MFVFLLLPLTHPFLSPSLPLLQEEKVVLLTPESCLQTPLSPDDLQWITDNRGRMGTHNVSLDYHSYSPRAVLAAVLPADSDEIPTGFEVVGHIAHLNLRKEFLPYKVLIGKLSAVRRPKLWK